MAEYPPKQLPKFEFIDELVDFFDHQDLGDYLDSVPEVECEVDIKRHMNPTVLKKEAKMMETSTLAEQAISRLQTLPDPLIREVLDFMDLLLHEPAESQTKSNRNTPNIAKVLEAYSQKKYLSPPPPHKSVSHAQNWLNKLTPSAWSRYSVREH